MTYLWKDLDQGRQDIEVLTHGISQKSNNNKIRSNESFVYHELGIMMDLAKGKIRTDEVNDLYERKLADIELQKLRQLRLEDDRDLWEEDLREREEYFERLEIEEELQRERERQAEEQEAYEEYMREQERIQAEIEEENRRLAEEAEAYKSRQRFWDDIAIIDILENS